MTIPREVILSGRAYTDIVNETIEHLRTETGGILVGRVRECNWYILESLDPGPKSIFKAAFFEYDHEYVTHLANKRRRYYKAGLQLLGLWHRHPGSMDHFSSTDDETNSRYLEYCKGAVVSGLVNIDPAFRLTFYAVSGPPLTYAQIPVKVGDQYVPSDLLELWDGESLLKSAGLSGTDGKTSKFWSKLLSFGRQSTSDLPSCASEASGTKAVPAPPVSDEQLLALDMLDEEIGFLDSQIDYSYQISLKPHGVLVTLHRISDVAAWPNQMPLLFTMAEGKKIVIVGKQVFDFKPGCSKLILSDHMMKSE